MGGIGLVLEGGGLRGMYTSGVLDFFLKNRLDVDYCVGVSAGACNALSYISKQYRLNYRMMIRCIRDRNYLSFLNLIKNGSMFNLDMMFDSMPDRRENFDRDMFRLHAGNFYVAATDCETGRAEYFRVNDFDAGRSVLKASSSLPLISDMVEYEGYRLLDGGLADPIPIRKSVEDGNERHIVVLTQSMGFRERPAMFMGLMEFKYKDYPRLLAVIRKRHEIYNETLDFIMELERQGDAIVLRPSVNVRMSAVDRDMKKLKTLYNTGFEDASRLYDDIWHFVK